MRMNITFLFKNMYRRDYLYDLGRIGPIKMDLTEIGQNQDTDRVHVAKVRIQW